MALTEFQLKQNELWLINIIRMTKTWMWQDYMIMFEITSDNKLVPPNEEAYRKLSKIVRPQFMKVFVK